MPVTALGHNKHINVTPHPTPADLAQKHPLTPVATEQITDTRRHVIDCMEGRDKRTILIIGPCSEDDSLQPDDTPSVVAFARELQKISQEKKVRENLLIIMRYPPAKPRTDLGLAGLEQKDVMAAHRLLTDISNMGMPLAIEIMNRQHIARYGHLLSLGWIGARNIRDTHLRHSLSAYADLPVLCKNGEHGEVKPALQAVKTINESHENASITLPDDRTAYVSRTSGNPNTGLIWRGGSEYMSPEGFERGLLAVAETGQPYGVDCSHGNTMAHDRDHQKSVSGQKACLDHLLDMISSGKLEKRPKAIMLEAYLQAGNDTSRQTPGRSWTDPCLSLKDARAAIAQIAESLG